MKHNFIYATIVLLILGYPLVNYANTEPDSIKIQVTQVLSKLMEAWAAGDGTAFSEQFTEDADFVPYFGIHIYGNKEIAAAHQPVFDGFLKGSKLKYILQSVRQITKDVYIVHTLGSVTRAGITTTNPEPTAIQSFVMVLKNGSLVIESFQNTLIEESPGAPKKQE